MINEQLRTIDARSNASESTLKMFESFSGRSLSTD
jgi:hypothetical protein